MAQDYKDLLIKATEALRKVNEEKLKQKVLQNEEERKVLVAQIGADLIEIMKPAIDTIKSIKDEVRGVLANLEIKIPEIKIPEIKTPELKMPEIKIPEIKIPEVKIPLIKVPKPEVIVNVPPLKIPDFPKFPQEMDIKGWVNLMGYDKGLLNNPLPVQLRDVNGKPVNLLENLTTVIGGGGGGKHDYFTIKGYSQSAFTELMNADGRLRVSVETGGSGLTDNELRASAVPVSQASGAIWSNYITGAFGSAVVDSVWNADNRLRVSLETGGSGLTDSELRATAVPVSQVSGAIWSVSVNDAFRTTVASTLINSDDRLRVSVETGGSGLTDSELRASAVPVSQVSGASWSVVATATDLDIRDINVAQDEILIHQVSGSRWSVEATQGTSPWVVSATDLDVRDLDYTTDDVSTYQVSGHSWSVQATISGALSSAVVVGPTVADSPDDGNAPIQIGGVARTANPTAVAANDIVKNTYDDLGRQLIRPMQVRDLIVTAYATLTTGTEATLLAASAGSFHDLIYIMGANNSDVAVTVDIRPVTAGNVVMSIQIPANGTAGVSLAVPYPQSGSDTGNNWTVDMADVTGTTVYLSALFSREI